ncbi:transcriptional regulator [Halococcus agarilyticus]|uniref:transcriptional regulator n=1 Tax=Halococcus agarilyticus TaxID=1232219 RepID=UPI000677A697|nr:transcriptional regulator [Halococcus agarilyticus]
MTADDTPIDEDTGGENETADDEIEPADVRAELDRQRSGTAVTDGASPASDSRSEGTEEFDEGIVELLSAALDTDRAARVYVAVRRRRSATAEEVAAGTGLYPDSVREMLAELRDEGVVDRHTRTTDHEDDEFEYTAIPPSELVRVMVDRVRDEFDARLGLDRLPDERSEPTRRTPRSDPVTITVEDASESDGTTDDESSDSDGMADGSGE